jgi:histidinol-phosphate aminotransferase
MITKTIKSFNQFTRNALLEKVKGYVNKTKSLEAEILRIKKRNNLSKIYRFDLGENIDGFSPKVNAFLENLHKNEVLFSKLHRYPDITHLSLRERLGATFNVPRQNIVISAGLDSVLDLITRVFFEYKDVFLMPVPDFFLFESYSERMGASPVFLQLEEENNFAWTERTYQKFYDLIIKFRPKVIFLSNPSNPTGQIIPDEKLVEIIEFASSYNTFVVIDEAYREFTGNPNDSIAKYSSKYPNLIILRTFSKAFGLAGLRLGYLICSDEQVIEALLLHRHHFPVTQLSLNIASIASKDMQFIYKTQQNTDIRRDILFNNLKTLKSFKYIPSVTNIFMLKNKFLPASELDKRFKRRGIIASQLNITGVVQDNYLRITIRKEEDNLHLFNVCKEIDNECRLLS